MEGLDARRNRRGRLLEARTDGIRDIVTEDGAIIREQEIGGVLKANAQERNADRFKGFRFAPNFRRVASIPAAVIDIYMARGIDLLNDRDAMRQFLNDRDNLPFRTTTERV